MCGIFGVWGHPRAAALTHLGLYSLQHRGQESAGIVAVGGDGVARSVRKMGIARAMCAFSPMLCSNTGAERGGS